MALPDVPAHPWLIEIAIEPKSKAERDRLNADLEMLVGDSDLDISTDPESGQIILRGKSEQQLADAIDRLRCADIDITIGPPHVAYRETITRPVTVEYVHKKQIRGSGEFAGVKIIAEPLAAGSGFAIENRSGGDAIPAKYIAGVEKGLASALGSGVLAGFPVVDLKVALIDGKYHDVDSSALTFEIAARMALREALQQGAPVILEPVMSVEVTTPAESEAEVIRDLESRGRIHAQDERGGEAVIRATAPLANMLGYSNALRGLSGGRASFFMRFDHYAAVPPFDDNPPFPPAIGMRA